MNRVPFTPDNCEGYTDPEMQVLNEEFDRRWNGWDVEDSQLFFYADGTHMSEDDAIKRFQHEVAGR